jgi:hypothetical protein
MKKLLVALLFLAACDTPYKIIETTTTDSTGKQLTIKTKYYQQSDGTYVHVSTYPVYGGGLLYPYYRPTIVVPYRPIYHYRRR